MRSLYLLGTALLAFTGTFAQQRFVPATVVLPSGDSLTGEMDYRKWDMEPRTVSFRANGSITTYSPETLKSFRIHEDSEQYLSVPGDIDVTDESVGHLSTWRTRTIDSGRHFFRVVQDGAAQLLLHTDIHKRQHFALRDADTVLHLTRETRYIDKPGTENHGKLQVLNHFQQQLETYMSACSANIRFDVLEYRAESLSRAIVKYTHCKTPGTVVAVKKKDPEMRAMFGVMGGVSMNIIDVAGYDYHPLTRNKMGTSFTPVLGVFYDVPLSRRRQQLMLSLEALYENRRIHTDYNPDKIDVNFHYAVLQTHLRYTYPVGEVRPYVSAGIGIMAKLGKGKDDFFSEGSEKPTTALAGGRDLFLPLSTAVGVRYKRMNGELRVMLPHELEDMLAVSVQSISPQLIFRYTLRK